MELVKDLKPVPIFFDKYVRRVLNEQFEQLKPQYPQVIKIAPTCQEMLKGNMNPSAIITIDEPIRLDDGTPIWFESASNECFLRFGYTNFDARYIGKDILSMEYIHGFLGGSSGHGKSVTLNSMMGSLFYEYAPWELDVKLSDAKITEFKKYGTGHRIPHITTIAATADADYVISVLETAVNEMTMRGKLFGALKVSNLKSFRKKTGLMMPRVLIVMDEVESTFRLAGKKAPKIAKAIDDFARLGRSSGFHIIMATQNMSSDIPSSAVGQIRLRMCLGANQKTSESVLGNKGAQEYFGKIGKLIVNTEVMTGGDTRPFNVKYQTPFITDDMFDNLMEILESVGKRVKYPAHMSFYDEEDIKTVAQFDVVQNTVYEKISDRGELSNGTPIILGYPAFVTDDKDELLKLWLTNEDIENICVLSAKATNYSILLHLIHNCLKRNYKILHYASDTKIDKIVGSTVGTFEVRDATKPPFSSIGNLINRRLFLLQLDNVAERMRPNEDSINEELRKLNLSIYLDNQLVMKRCAAFYLMSNKKSEFYDMYSSIANDLPTFAEVIDEFKKYNAMVSKITQANFFNVAIFVGNLAKIIGLGRDAKMKEVSRLKKLLQDAPRANVVFVLYTSSFDGLNDLANAIRYSLFDMPDSKDWTRLRTEAPAELSSKLVVLYDSQDYDNPQKKFKRTVEHL